MNTVEVRGRAAWRKWLEKHHASVSEVWLIFRKGAGRDPGLTYEDAVREALCFGWIDSLIKYVDEERYARKFTPRKADSRWSTINRRRYEELRRDGLLTPAGLLRAPTAKNGDAPRPSLTAIPGYIKEALERAEPAWSSFHALAPSHRRHYIAWIEAAKRPETREKRLREAVERLSAGRTLGMK